MEAPLVLTVLLNETAQQFLNQQRKQCFPPERNFLEAHLTLFHQLPNEAFVLNTVEAICASQRIISLAVTEVVSVGKGVAYKIESAELIRLFRKLQQQWRPFLIPQDKQGLWPHVTVQNKVSKELAKDTLQRLQLAFTPFTAFANGLVLWQYLNGPWQLYRTFLFSG